MLRAPDPAWNTVRMAAKTFSTLKRWTGSEIGRIARATVIARRDDVGSGQTTHSLAVIFQHHATSSANPRPVGLQTAEDREDIRFRVILH